MQSSNVPVKFPSRFGESAGSSYITNPIPTPSQIGTNPAAASFTDGFPPGDFAAGGPFMQGQDLNGILYMQSAWARWLAAGGPITYDGTFQSAVGGYPLGAVIQSATTAGKFWRSTTENNTTNPDTGGAGWVNAFGSQSPSLLSGNGWKKYPDPNSPTGYFLEQWGSGLATAKATAITFPVAFGTSVYSVIVGEAQAVGTWSATTPVPTIYAASGATVTGFNLYALQWQLSGSTWVAATSQSYYWRAIGY